MNNINPNIKFDANDAALLNVLMYLNIEDVNVKDGELFSKIILYLGDIYDSPETYEEGTMTHIQETQGYKNYIEKHEEGSEADYQDRQRQYEILKNASATNEHLANMKIGNQSSLMDNPNYNEAGLNACTFTDINGNVKVVYRGTGSGEWIDNGIGIGGLVYETPQQIEAMKYFDRIVDENNYKQDINIEICGHSKGGNKAQYTTINSKYNYLIDYCFNFDGQGMSPEAIEEFKRRDGDIKDNREGYDKSISKMYGFYAENDYVNPLGITIIPKEHRLYFESTIDMNGIVGKKKYHYADDYLKLDAFFSEQTEQGDLSKFLEVFSIEISSLPPKERTKVAKAIMGLMQGDKQTVNGESVSWKDYLIGGSIALPVLLDELSGYLIETVKDKYGAAAELGTALILTRICPLLFVDDLANVLITDFKEVVGIALENLEKLGNFIIKKIEQFGNKLMEIAEGIGKALCKFAVQVKEALGKLQVYATGIANGIVHTGIAVGVAIDNYKNKVINVVSNFFTNVSNGVKRFIAMSGKAIVNTWDSAVDKATKGVDRIVNATRDEIKKQYEAFKEGTNHLVTYTKETLDNFGEKGVSMVRNFSKKVAIGMASYASTRLSVDLFRLADLQSKIRYLESNYFGEKVYQILNEANRITSDVDRNYSEYYVQQQVRSVNLTCDNIRESNRRVCDALQRKTNSLRYALEHYKQIEDLLIMDIRV
jgi:ribosomal 50S subunit-associated protein YjgA (DUF615 family)